MKKDQDTKNEMEEKIEKEDLESKSELQENEDQSEPKSDSSNDAEENKADDPEVKEPNEYDKLKAEYDELHNKYLRLYSEFDNFRRRTSKEKLDLIDTANERLLLEILPVVDDFERAMTSMNETAEVASVCEGVTLIFNKMKKTLENSGVKEIDCIGESFDPEIHEAITKIPAPKKKLKGKVVDQIQKGYTLKEKVIRFSKVIVGE